MFGILLAGLLLHSYHKQFVNALNGIDRPDVAFRIQVVFIAANLVLNVALIARFGWIGAAVATAVSAAIGLVLSFWSIRSAIEFEVPVGEILRQVAAAALMGIFVYIGLTLERDYSLLGNNAAVVALLVGGGAAVYFLSLFGISSGFRRTVVTNVPW